MSKKPKLPKQLTLDNLPDAKENPIQISAPIHVKRIIITEIDTLTKEDELALKVDFAWFHQNTRFQR